MTDPIVRWYVPRWGGAPSRREFVRETDKFLVSSRNGRETREAKRSTYYSFYETEEAALAAVAASQATKDERKRIERIRDAAPELLQALQWMLDAYDTEQWCDTAENKSARAAIAKATGHD